MRSELPSLVGRDHLSFRSYYQPVRNVIDGDLCELFNSMDVSKKKNVAEGIERAPNEVRGRQCCASVLLGLQGQKLIHCYHFTIGFKEAGRYSHEICLLNSAYQTTITYLLHTLTHTHTRILYRYGYAPVHTCTCMYIACNDTIHDVFLLN